MPETSRTNPVTGPGSAPVSTAVVLLAAGEGRRVGADRNKVLLPLGGAPVIAWSLRTALALHGVSQVVVVVRREDRTLVEDLIRREFPSADLLIVDGGETRHASEWNAIRALRPHIESGTIDVVAIHDTARPLAGGPLFDRVIGAAHRYGGALPVVAQRSLIPRDGSGPAPTDHSQGLVAVQTPQAFRGGQLLRAYVAAEADGFVGTDTASCLERYTDTEVHGVASDVGNLKITFPEDVALAERLLA